LILSVSKLREMVIECIPLSSKHAIGVGIGFFITFVGLKNSEIIVANPATLVCLGNFSDLGVLLTVIGLLVTLILLIRKVPAAIFIGMAITVVAGLLMGVLTLPQKIIALPPSIQPVFCAFFSVMPNILTFDMITVIFSFLLVGFFDMTATLMSIALRTGMTDDKGQLINGKKAVVANAGSAIFSSIAGCSPTTPYIESLAGVAAGGRTGLTAVFVAIFMSIMLIFSGLLSVVTAQVTAPALMCVGVLMVSSLKEIEWNKIEIAIPSFAIIIVMTLSYGITNGITAGFILYPITMTAVGRAKKVHPLMWILSAIFVLYGVWIFLITRIL
jgi:AGZA family xanthine/uracil permease-like MFS transporter